MRRRPDELDALDLEEQFGPGAYAFVLKTDHLSLGAAISAWIGDHRPRPDNLMSVFQGSQEEVAAHNQAAWDSSEPVRIPAIEAHRPARRPRPRERRASHTRSRGSRRVSRSCSRGGDSGDDPDGEPEPDPGHLEVSGSGGHL